MEHREHGEEKRMHPGPSPKARHTTEEAETCTESPPSLHHYSD